MGSQNKKSLRKPELDRRVWPIIGSPTSFSLSQFLQKCQVIM